MRVARAAATAAPRSCVTAARARAAASSRAELARCEAPGINTLGAGDEPADRLARGARRQRPRRRRQPLRRPHLRLRRRRHRPPPSARRRRGRATRPRELLHGLGDVAAHPARIELAARLVRARAGRRAARLLRGLRRRRGRDRARRPPSLAHRRAPGSSPSIPATTASPSARSPRPRGAEFRAPFRGAPPSPHVVRLPFGCPLERRSRAPLARGATSPPSSSSRSSAAKGVLVPPAGWLAGLAAALPRGTARSSSLDEILTGFGRTGARFAVDARRRAARPPLLRQGARRRPADRRRRRAAPTLMEAWRTGGEALHTAHLRRPSARLRRGARDPRRARATSGSSARARRSASDLGARSPPARCSAGVVAARPRRAAGALELADRAAPPALRRRRARARRPAARRRPRRARRRARCRRSSITDRAARPRARRASPTRSPPLVTARHESRRA